MAKQKTPKEKMKISCKNCDDKVMAGLALSIAKRKMFADRKYR